MQPERTNGAAEAVERDIDEESESEPIGRREARIMHRKRQKPEGDVTD